MLNKFGGTDLDELLRPPEQHRKKTPVIPIAAAGSRPDEPSKDLILRQVQRFSAYPKFPGKVGQLDLARAFGQACSSDEQVIRVADHLIQIAEYAPIPANVYRIAEQMARSNYEEIPSPRQTSCFLCGGTGWTSSILDGQQQQARRCYCKKSQNKSDSPAADEEGSLADGMSAADLARWRAIAERPANDPAQKAKRDLALAMLAKHEV